MTNANIIHTLMEHGYTAEQGAAAGLYLCALLLMGYVVELDYDRSIEMYKAIVLKVYHEKIERVGGSLDKNLATTLARAVGVVRDHLGAEEFARQLRTLTPGAANHDH